MNRVQQQFVKDAIEYSHMLTEWEIDFINSLAEKEGKDPNYELSPKQNAVLNRISQKIN